MSIRIERTVSFVPTVEELAEQFAGLKSDEQCAFFVEVARIASTWEDRPQMQWLGIANDLKTDGDERTKDMLRDIAAFLEDEAGS